jgi:hypothetical protein
MADAESGILRSMANDTPSVGVDNSLRLVSDGRRFVLGPYQVRLLHALWQTAGGWLPRISIPAVLAGVPFTLHHRPHLTSRQHATATQSLGRLRAQGLVAMPQEARVALTSSGDSLMRSLLAWEGWPDYWARIAAPIALERGQS